MAKTVSSIRSIKTADREAIIEEAIRLNGTARSQNGLGKLCRFAEKHRGIRINKLTVRRLLKNFRPKARQGPRTPKHRRTGVRPSHAMSLK